MIKEFLNANSETKYSDFNKKLIESKYQILGVRLPTLKKFAKQLSLADFDLSDISTVEEVLLYGYCAGNLKTEKEQLSALTTLLPFIDNWCSCDCTVQALKKLNGKTSYQFFKSLLTDAHPFYVRVGIIGLMRNFLKANLDQVLKDIKKVENQDYYVKMALAWLYCEVCIINTERAKVEIAKIDDQFVRNKAISKAHDSFRVSQADKDFLKTLRIK